ncbi:hypothetical protein EON65_44115, partial [archaeon]
MRLFNREKVYSKKTSDLATDDASIIAIAFSIQGKYLSVAFSNSAVILLNLETGNSLDSKASLANIQNGVRQMQWLEVPDFNQQTFSLDLLSQDFFTPSRDISSRSIGQDSESVFQQLHETLENLANQLLMLLTPSHQMVAFAFGLFPILKVDLGVDIRGMGGGIKG